LIDRNFVPFIFTRTVLYYFFIFSLHYLDIKYNNYTVFLHRILSILLLFKDISLNGCFNIMILKKCLQVRLVWLVCHKFLFPLCDSLACVLTYVCCPLLPSFFFCTTINSQLLCDRWHQRDTGKMAHDMEVHMKQRSVTVFLHEGNMALFHIHQCLLNACGDQTVDVSTVKWCVLAAVTVGPFHWCSFFRAQHAVSCSLLVKMHS